MKPTIGRIVLYNSYAPHSLELTLLPALVQRVQPDGKLTLWVFGSSNVWVEVNVEKGEGLRTWQWPKREIEIVPQDTVLA